MTIAVPPSPSQADLALVKTFFEKTFQRQYRKHFNSHQKHMKRILSTTIVLVSLTGLAAAQQLYMPRNVARAYVAGTRSADGKPGPKYWQNKGVYNISISV